MISLLNLALAGGLAAAALPTIVHLLKQRKVIERDWSAMRFLKRVKVRHRRRLLVDKWLLLAIRTLLLLFLALSMMRPMWRSTIEGPQHQRQGRVAAVLAVDDSFSSSMGRESPALEGMKKLLLAYLETLSDGDEVSLLRLSQLSGSAPPPFMNLDAAKRAIRSLTAAPAQSDPQALMGAAIAQFHRHINPTRELIFAHDGSRGGWDNLPRWRELQSRWLNLSDELPSQVAIFRPEREKPYNNISIRQVRADRHFIVPGQPFQVEVNVAFEGDELPSSVRCHLKSGDQKLQPQILHPQRGSGETLHFDLTLDDPGSHLIQVWLEGVKDDLSGDNRRMHTLHINDRFPVLLIEDEVGEGLGGSLGFLAAALDPTGEGDGFFDLQRLSHLDLSASHLKGIRTVVLGDLPYLQPEAITLLENWVGSGGGLLVLNGPRSHPQHLESHWVRGGDGFLPALPVAMNEPQPFLRPSPSGLVHRALLDPAFFEDGENLLKSAWVRQFWTLKVPQRSSDKVNTVMQLEDGSPLLVESPKALGRVMQIVVPLNGEWSFLPREGFFVPWVRGIITHLGSRILPERNLQFGQHIAWVGPYPEGSRLVGPNGQEVEFKKGRWEGIRALTTQRLLNYGTYCLELAEEPHRTIFHTLNPGEEESRSGLLREEEEEERFEGFKAQHLNTPQKVREAFSGLQQNGLELWPWLLVGCMAMLFLETMVTGRQVRLEKKASEQVTP